MPHLCFVRGASVARNKKKRHIWPDIPEALTFPVVDNHTHFPVRGERDTAPETSSAANESTTDDAPKRWGVPEILEAMSQAGVAAAITCGCEVPTLASTVEVAERYPNVYAAIAIHPNDAPLHCGITDVAPDGLEHGLDPWHRDYSLDEAISLVEAHARSNAVVAIGETGLDYYRSADAAKSAQIESFEKHIELAKSLDLPLQIHDRDAHADVVATLRRVGAPSRTVFHCFSGDVSLARVLAEEGWYASFAGPVTYPANDFLREALQEMPRELILAETDAPYLTPVPWRGHPNAAYAVAYTVRALAEYLDLGEEEMCALIANNTEEVYGINVSA